MVPPKLLRALRLVGGREGGRRGCKADRRKVGEEGGEKEGR